MRKAIIIVTAGCLCACSGMFPDKVEVVTLGIVQESVTVPAAAGEDGARVISDRDYSYDIVSGGEWLSKGLSGSDTLSFSFSANSGYRRSAVIRVGADGREDFLTVKQEGVYSESISLSSNTENVTAEGGTISLRVYSALPSDCLAVRWSDGKAIDNVILDEYRLRFNVKPTTNRDRRTYTVSVYYIDGWGDTIEDTVTIVQEAYD